MHENDEEKEFDQLLAYVQDAVEPPPPPSSSIKRETFELAKMVVWVVVMFYGLRTFVVEGFEIRGHSMESTLDDHERVLVAKFIYMFRPIERGDVVVFRFPNDPKRRFVKRVIGLPGDTVRITQGRVYVNDKLVDEPYVYVSGHRVGGSENLPAVRVPDGHYYMLGDHRNLSSDSRSWGPVPRRDILGRAVFRFWPPSEIGLL